MAKNDNRVKCAQVRKLVEDKQFKKAVMLLDTLNLEKAKATVTDCYAFAEAALKTGRYELAEKLLLQIHEAYASRKAIYQLIRLMLKKGSLEEAEKYYGEYVEKYPDYEERYILRYRIDKARKADYKVRIASLEQLKRVDYVEEWAYELAKLYHKAGMKKECMEECADIILWFGEGIIVEKAKMLRAYYSKGESTLAGNGREAERKESRPDYYMNTKDLGREVKQLQREEKEELLKKELEEELEPTINIQDAIQEELKKDGGNPAFQETYRLLREEVVSGKEGSEKTEAAGEAKKAETDSKINGVDLNEIFGALFQEPSIREQTLEILSGVLKPGEGKKHFLLIGEEPEKNLLYARSLAKAFHMLGKTEQSRVAKIQGGRLNGMRLDEQKEKLAGGTLYVEQPGQMYTPTVRKLIAVMEELGERLVIIFAAGAEEAELLLEENYDLRDYFGYRIWL